MSAPYATLTASDYLDAAQALLPSGPAWPRDPNTVFGKYMSSVANVAWLAHRVLAELFVTELDPGAANMLLPDWEAAFGVTARGSKAERRINLKAVIADPGGFSNAHCVAVAAAAGVEITGADVFKTSPFQWELHAPAATPADAQAALESAIALHNRATCVVTILYDR
jgi:uncharacterized protein YmfQ (DUF2313 family)